jgi:hypothetical protein
MGYRELGGLLFKPGLFDETTNLGKMDLKLREWATGLLKRLEFDSGAFHIEAVVSTSGSPRLIEVNPRPEVGRLQRW